MFKKKQKTHITFKDMIKKINYQLTCNYFTFDEFYNLDFKKKYKIIKLISKINKIKLKRKEIISIVNQIIELHESKKINKSPNLVFSLFNWTFSPIKIIFKKAYYYLKSFLTFIFIFRLNRQKILRI